MNCFRALGAVAKDDADGTGTKLPTAAQAVPDRALNESPPLRMSTPTALDNGRSETLRTWCEQNDVHFIGVATLEPGLTREGDRGRGR